MLGGGGQTEEKLEKQENGRKSGQAAGDPDAIAIRVSDSGEETSLAFRLSFSSSVS